MDSHVTCSQNLFNSLNHNILTPPVCQPAENKQEMSCIKNTFRFFHKSHPFP